MVKKINGILLLILASIFIITFFTRNNYRSVNEIMPGVLSEPVQMPVDDDKTFSFQSEGYSYEVTPLFDYEINGLIVSKMNYKLFTIYKTEKVFPFDLCLIWGSNAANKLYQKDTLKFSQDCRWCWAEWYENIDFNLAEISNNHLLIQRLDLENRIKALVLGDQVKIRGKLVNVKARLVGRKEDFNPQYAYWNTSSARGDSGQGACEIIYVEDVEILKKANTVSRNLFDISRNGLIAWALFNFLYFLSSLFQFSSSAPPKQPVDRSVYGKRY